MRECSCLHGAERSTWRKRVYMGSLPFGKPAHRSQRSCSLRSRSLYMYVVRANPQKTVLFLLGVCYRTEEVPSFLRHREYVHCIAYTSQCAFCYCCAYQPSPSNDCTQQSLLSNDCAQQHMLCIDMLLVPLPLPSLALHTTCAATTARANTCFALTYCL